MPNRAGAFFINQKNIMSKANRDARRKARLERHNAARAARAARKAARLKRRQDRINANNERKDQRHASKLERQRLRQQAREERLKRRLERRAGEIGEEKEATDKDIAEAAGQSGIDPSEEATNRLENNPESMARMKGYISSQGGGQPEELSNDAGELAQQATMLRGEEIDDIRKPIVNEVEEEGDSMSEDFENFEFFEAATYMNYEEDPQCYENYEVIDPSTWATISAATKGVLEGIAKKQFAKNKSFLGKTKSQWAAPEDPNSIGTNVKGEIIEGEKKNFIKDNLTAIVLIAIVLSFLGYFAFKKK